MQHVEVQHEVFRDFSLFLDDENMPDIIIPLKIPLIKKRGFTLLRSRDKAKF